jgi:dihydroorotase
MSTLLIKNGTVIDPLNKRNPERLADIFVNNGKIAKIGKNLDRVGDTVIDAKGKVVTAGLVDMHVHLREPGREDKETIATATRAAAKGGVTTVLGMPNTSPRIDNQAAVKFVLERGRQEGVVNVFTTGNLSKRGEGQEMAELWELKNEGVKIVTDDGDDIQDLGLYRKVLQYCQTHDLTAMSHSENHDLKEGVCMHEGWVSTQLGLPAAPESTETAHVAHLLEILREVPARFHFTHMSSARSAKLIAAAKAEGLPITIDVTPHHLILNEEAYLGYDTQAKVCPPLRSEANRAALVEALKSGLIDAIASDHAPHTLVEKYVEFESAAVGMVGLETLFSLLYTKLVKEWKAITLPRLIELLTVNPAKIMREEKGLLQEGADADISIWDLQREYKIDKSKFESKGRNTPFHGWKVYGQATDVLVGGKPVVRAGKLIV